MRKSCQNAATAILCVEFQVYPSPGFILNSFLNSFLASTIFLKDNSRMTFDQNKTIDYWRETAAYDLETSSTTLCLNL